MTAKKTRDGLQKSRVFRPSIWQ